MKRDTQASHLNLKLLPELLLPWYQKHARVLPWRVDCNPYHVWISEIMLQQTRVEAVKPYYIRFLSELPTVAALAAVDDERLMKLWEGLGYYSRARNLKKAAQMIMAEYSGIFPNMHDEILRLPGIGPYTAGAVASICFGLPTPAVDGNVLRVISRVTESFDNIDEPATKKWITAALAKIYPTAKERCGLFTQSLMELGAMVCVPNGAPDCEACPLTDICIAFQKDVHSQLPVRAVKKDKRLEERTVFLLSCQGKIAITQRENTGLLASMWQFPNVLGKPDINRAWKQVEEWGVQPASLIQSVERAHIFTHIKWDMVCYYIDCKNCDSRFVWAKPAELASRYALPSAFRMFLDSSKLFPNKTP